MEDEPPLFRPLSPLPERCARSQGDLLSASPAKKRRISPCSIFLPSRRPSSSIARKRPLSPVFRLQQAPARPAVLARPSEQAQSGKAFTPVILGANSCFATPAVHPAPPFLHTTPVPPSRKRYDISLCRNPPPPRLSSAQLAVFSWPRPGTPSALPHASLQSSAAPLEAVSEQSSGISASAVPKTRSTAAIAPSFASSPVRPAFDETFDEPSIWRDICGDRWKENMRARRNGELYDLPPDDPPAPARLWQEGYRRGTWTRKATYSLEESIVCLHKVDIFVQARQRPNAGKAMIFEKRLSSNESGSPSLPFRPPRTFAELLKQRATSVHPSVAFAHGSRGAREGLLSRCLRALVLPLLLASLNAHREFETTLSNQPVVIDNGSGTIKAGFAGEDHPKCFFPSFVGRPKHVRVMAGAVEGDIHIGKKAQELRGLLKIKYPMTHGIVTDWDDMERIWQHVYSEELRTLPEEHPVLLTEAPLNPSSNREQAAQIFFETFNVPAMYMSIQAVLALYASGRTTGIVLDSGDGVTHAVPVYEGFSMPHAIRRVDVAGRDVTDHLQMLLRKAGYHLHTTAEKEVVRIIKEKACYIALNPSKEEKEAASSSRGEDFRLPDGNVVRLGAERFRAPEILFNPELNGQEYAGVHQVVVDSINRADLDLRKALFANVVLSGGSTLTKGFGDRLLSEVKKLALKDIKIKIFAPPERKYSTFIGGSILAGLSTFKKMMITAEQYAEDPDVIHKLAF